VKQAKLHKKLIEDVITDSSFAISINNLPKDTTNREIKEAICRAGVEYNDIVYVNRCYKFSHIWDLKEKEIFWIDKKKHLDSYRESMKERGHPDWNEMYPSTKILGYRPFMPFPKEEEIDSNLQILDAKMLEKENQTIEHTGLAYVILKNREDVKRVIEYFKFKSIKMNVKNFIDKWCPIIRLNFDDGEQFKVCGRRVIVNEAPEPAEITWKNIDRKSRKFCNSRTIIIYVTILTIEAGIFLLICKFLEPFIAIMSYH